ncbi:MAG: hypothetical protein HFG79_04765 [Lachnospiraceae bacterium]|nr:hypothetical protein [Lachnospiraceae bacterium]
MAVLAIPITLTLTLTACGQGQSGKGDDSVMMRGQKTINRVDRYTSVLPKDYEWFDYKERAAAYDNLVYDEILSGVYTPFIWQDVTYDTFGIAAYVGDGRSGSDGSEEAVTTIASVLSATLLGIDKSSQNGKNYVSMLHAYFSEQEKIILNNPSGSSRSTSMWYLIYPTILCTQVSAFYPEETQIREDVLCAIESWYKAAEIMAAGEGFNYTGFDFIEMIPYQNDIWKEPDSAAGIAVLMWYGYVFTGEKKYLKMSEHCLDFVDTFEGSSLYEALLYFAPALAAKFNAEYGAQYDVEGLIGDVMNGGSIPRGGWGSMAGTWGDYSVNGLMGSTTDGGGYAFSMNTFAAAYAMSPLAKYDTRYAQALGKWYLQIASGSRYFFADKTSPDNQSAASDKTLWEQADAWGFCIPYEGIRKSQNGKTPWFGGDPTVYGWAETDFSLYSGAHIGMMGAVIQRTDVDGILRINCGAQASEQEDFAAFLLFNPHEKEKTVTYLLEDGSFDLFDSVRKEVIACGVSGEAKLTFGAGEAMVIIELPAGSQIVHEGTGYFVDGRQIASDMTVLHINGLSNNDTVSGEVRLDVDCVSTNPEVKVDKIVLTIDKVSIEFSGNDVVSFRTKDYGSGSKTVLLEVYMQDGTYDKTDLRLRFE